MGSLGLHNHNVDPDEVANCVLSAFNALPAKRKPRKREDGSREWVPLSGIVLSRGTTPTPYNLQAHADNL